MGNSTVGYTEGAGKNIAVDDVAGTEFQRIKVTIGDAGVDGGSVSLANPMPVTGTLLVTGVATAANQVTELASLSSIDGKTPALGQALAASSVPIVLTAAQLTTLTPPAAITGYALEAGHLAAIDTSTAKIPALGQALAAASVPVVMTAAQLTTLTPPAAITGYTLEAGNIATILARTPALGAATTANSSPVTLASDQTVPISSSALTSLATAVHAEDAASADLDAGVAILAVRQDVPITDTSLSADYSSIKTDPQGRLWINSDVIGGYLNDQNDLLAQVITELRVMTAVLQAGLNVKEESDMYRNDPSFQFQ